MVVAAEAVLVVVGPEIVVGTCRVVVGAMVDGVREVDGVLGSPVVDGFGTTTGTMVMGGGS